MVQSSLKENQKHAQIEPYNLSPLVQNNSKLEVYFYFLCLDLRHKQKHTASSLVYQVFLLNKPMKNSIHKQKHTATRQGHHALHHQLTQKHTADQVELYALHGRSVGCVAILQHLFFFYLYIDYKHKHAQDPAACHVVHAKIYFFFIYIQTTSTSERPLREQAPGSEARARCNFFI